MFESLDNFFNSSFITSLFGAIAGSATILLINWLQEQKRLLGQMNAMITINVGSMQTLLLMKKQHVIPLIKSYESAWNFKHKRDKDRLPLYLLEFDTPNLKYEILNDGLFNVVADYPSVYQAVMDVQRSLHEVESSSRKWNQLVTSTMELEHNDRFRKYFGENIPGVKDTYCADVIVNYQNEIEHALYHSGVAIDLLTKAAKKILPFWYRKNIARMVFHPDFKDLTPTSYDQIMDRTTYLIEIRDPQFNIHQNN